VQTAAITGEREIVKKGKMPPSVVSSKQNCHARLAEPIVHITTEIAASVFIFILLSVKQKRFVTPPLPGVLRKALGVPDIQHARVLPLAEKAMVVEDFGDLRANP